MLNVYPDYQDVWSSVDGSDWTRVTENGYPCRQGSDVVVFQDKMWCLGGGTANKQPVGAWYSEDGANWTRRIPIRPPRSWKATPRWCMPGRFFLLGGDDPGNGRMSDDVWSSADGAQWVKTRSNPPFGEVTVRHCFEFAGEMCLLGGNRMRYHGPEDFSGSYDTQLWCSVDGENWKMRGEPNDPKLVQLHAQPTEYWPQAPYGLAMTVFQDWIWTFFGRGVDYWPSVWNGH